MKQLFFACIGLALVLYACKTKKEDPKPDDPGSSVDTEMIRISRHQWKIYRMELGGTDIWNNAFLVKECQRDDSYRFYKDSTLLQYENSNVCDGGKDSTKSSWKFYDGRKKVIATIFNITDTADIISLQDSSMQLSFDYMDQPAMIYFKKR